MTDFKIDKEVTSKLKFSPEEQHGNLCRGYLTNVEVELHKVARNKEDGTLSSWEFADHTIPSLIFNFNQHKASNLDKDRYYTHTERIIGNMKSEENGGGEIDIAILEKIYEGMWSRIKHIHDCFEGFPNYVKLNKEVADAGAKLYANFASATKTAETTVKCLTTFFTAIAAAFNEGLNKAPIYKANDKAILCWIKLVSEYRNHKYLCIPTFVGTGFIEVLREKAKSTLTFNANESVVLGAGKPKQPDMPGVSDDLSPEMKRAMGME